MKNNFRFLLAIMIPSILCALSMNSCMTENTPNEPIIKEISILEHSNYEFKDSIEFLIDSAGLLHGGQVRYLLFREKTIENNTLTLILFESLDLYESKGKLYGRSIRFIEDFNKKSLSIEPGHFYIDDSSFKGGYNWTMGKATLEEEIAIYDESITQLKKTSLLTNNF